MQFLSKLEEATLIRRYKRFFAEIELNGKTQIAHVPNTGRLTGVAHKNAPCLVQKASNPDRKLKWTLEFVNPLNAWVGVNTQTPNQLVKEWSTSSQAPKHWANYHWLSEFSLPSRKRLDGLLIPKSFEWKLKRKPKWDDIQDESCIFVEVKNVTLKVGDGAYFPDAPTPRGVEHLEELIKLKKIGYQAEQIFVIQRRDCDYFSPADDIDPAYGETLRRAQQAGVTIKALQVGPLKNYLNYSLEKELPIKL